MITPLPSLDRTSATFRTDVDAFFGAALPAFSLEAEAARADVVTKQGQAAGSAAAAATSEGNALAHKNAAAASESNALTARNAAQAAQTAAQAAWDAFDDRYLGAKTVPPTLDNDGAALLDGALYWDTVLSGGCLRVWQTSAWVAIPANVASAITSTPAGTLAATNVQAAIEELDQDISMVASNSSGPAPPAVTLANMWWADTAAGLLKRRNAANSAWISVMPLTQTCASAGVNTDITSTAIMPGFLFGCTLSTAGASATMSISAGKAQDSTGMQLMALTAITKTTSAWAVGSAAGGLDLGTIAANTWYHFYVIRRPDTAVVDALLSLAPGATATAATASLTIASPCVATWADHGLPVGAPVKFSTTGALPTGMAAGTRYYVIAAGLTATAFQFAATQGGSAINSSGSQSGVHSVVSEPLLPANYTQYRRIGSGRTDGASLWRKFVQVGDLFLWDVAVSDVATAAQGASAILYVLSVPTGVKVEACYNALSSNTTAAGVLITSPDESDQAPSGVGAPLYSLMAIGNATANAAAELRTRTNASAQVRARATAVIEILRIVTRGWRDNRGRDQ